MGGFSSAAGAKAGTNSVEVGIPGGFEMQPRNLTVKQAGGKELAVEKKNRD
jgi:hypothetical protein